MVMDEKTLNRIKEKVKTLPLEPGVYIMLDSDGGVIYVGKAKQLKNRVSQYFQESQNHSIKTRNMVSKIADFDFIVAPSELEALLLECSLIKRHLPRYNILLKDGKGFPFIRADLKEAFPKFTMEPKILNDGARYFGPYGGRFTTRKIIDALTGALQLPDCDRKFPRDIGKERACLNYHMGRCLAPCIGLLSEADHRSLVMQAVALLEGRYEQVKRGIYEEMERAAEDLQFERAAALRDRYNAISKLDQKQNVVSGVMADTDAVGFYGGAKKCIAITHYIDGLLLDMDVEIVDASVEQTSSEIIDAFLTQFYAGRPGLPRFILLPEDIENRASLEEMLTGAAGRRVEIEVPKRGKRVDMVRLAEKNAREEAERLTSREDRNLRNLDLLERSLGLGTPPLRIEAYDVSNLSGQDIVASMVVYERGVPLKRDYRRFKIKGTDGQDDYGSMAEVMGRRFQRYLDGDGKFDKLPDLVLIDGGEVHARISRDAIKNLGIELPVYGMVKDGRHRTRALVDPHGREIGIAALPQLFSFIGRIQEETHRFAIEYNRSLRKKRIYGSELDKIEGIGPVRRAKLLKTFKSIKNIKQAALEELTEVVPQNVAEAILEYYGGKT